MKDCNGHVYSIPLYSTVQLGIIQDYPHSASSKTSTLPKMSKVSDIMQLKVKISPNFEDWMAN